MNVALVLLTYAPDAPAGLERSTASLACGLRELGHRTLIITSAEPRGEHDLIRLRSLQLSRPVTEDELLAEIADQPAVEDEVRALLSRHRIDVVCWADASFGLGYMAPVVAGVRTALKVAVPRTDPIFEQALARTPDVVVTNSPFVIGEAKRAGLDTSAWATVPNALLLHGEAPEAEERERLRRTGPIRIVARAEPHKGIRELIDATPPHLGRGVEIVLASAGFEYWPNMQRDVIAQCRQAAFQAPVPVRILPALPWQDVPAFFAGAAATIISTTSPETWCNAAAEALSAGTPVIAYDFGHVPHLTGPAGVMVPAGAPPAELWAATMRLLSSRETYHATSAAAPDRVAAHTPRAAASAFLDAVLPAPHLLHPASRNDGRAM